MAKWVYKFSEGNASMRNLLGGKGANLAEMTGLGMPIPQGFTVTTEACTDYYASSRKIREEIINQIFDAVSWLEEEVRRYTRTSACFSAFRCKSFNAGYDGYYS